MDDFNSEPTEETMRDFMELYDLKKVSPCAYMLWKSWEPFLYWSFSYKQKRLLPGH